MADENKIQFDVELNEGSVDASFKAVDERAVKSAKASAAVFGEAFQRQEQDLKDSIEKIVGSTKKVAEKSAKESAEVFGEMFRKQDEIYKASVKNSLDQAIAKITGSDAIKKSAKESAAVFEEAFDSGFLKDGSETIWDNILPKEGLANLGLANLAGGFFLLQQGASAAGAAINAALDFIIKGERDIKLDRRFTALATQAGIAADVIKKDLLTATKGFVEEGPLLNLASQAFVTIGQNAKALPQILELSRKAYTAFGGDVVENANAITQAIFTGQTRQLRSLGILVDTDRAYKDFAATLGTVPALLNDQQRQQALLNAILEKGGEAFKNIKVETDGAESSFQKLKTAANELLGALSVKSAQQSAGFFSTLANAATGALNSIRESITRSPIDQAKDRLAELESRLKTAQESLKNAEGSYSAFGRGGEAFFARKRQTIVELETQISSYRKQIQTATDEQKKLREEAEKTAKASMNQGGVDTTSPEYLARQEALTQRVLELNNQVQQSEVQLAQDAFNRLRDRANLEALTFAQRTQAETQFQQQKAQLEKFYADNGVVNETLRQQGREALEQQHKNRLLLIEQQYQDQKNQIFSQNETQALTASQLLNETLVGFEQQAQDTAVNAAKSFRNIGRSMFQGIGQASAQAFAAFGQAVANGQNALEAFGVALLNSLGQNAIQLGTMFILQGAAYTYAGYPEGPALIAAGAALAAFGGVLSALSGGARPSTGGAGGGSAGQFSGDQVSNPFAEPFRPEDTQPLTPQTAVAVTINGNVLDRRETGLEIAKILEEQFADQGLVVRGV